MIGIIVAYRDYSMTLYERKKMLKQREMETKKFLDLQMQEKKEKGKLHGLGGSPNIKPKRNWRPSQAGIVRQRRPSTHSLTIID